MGGDWFDFALLFANGRLVVFRNPGAGTGAWMKQIDKKLTDDGVPIIDGAFGRFMGDSTFAVIVAQENGIRRFAIPSDAPPADFQRLTGEPLNQVRGFAGKLSHVAMTPIDVNGDHRTDLLITADGGSMMMIYRGFGAFMADSDMTAELSVAKPGGVAMPITAAGARAAAAGDGPDDLLALSDEGRLLRARNGAGKDKH